MPTAPASAEPPFHPMGRQPPLFFLHIPKTSGSAQNAGLQALYGDGAIVHAEARLAEIRAGRAAPVAADCVSGHISLASWIACGATGYARATVLRDPWARLVSHVNWMDRFNQGIDPGTRARLAPAHARIADAVGRTDLEDASSLKHLYAELTEAGDDILFDNLQVRMLLPEKPPRGRPMTADDRAAAEAALADFKIVGMASDQSAALDAFAAHAGATRPTLPPAAVNPARSHRLHPGNVAAQAAFAAWYRHDTALVAATESLPGAVGTTATPQSAVGASATQPGTGTGSLARLRARLGRFVR